MAGRRGWLFLAAPQTWSYLLPSPTSTLQSLRALLAGGTPSRRRRGGAPGQPGPVRGGGPDRVGPAAGGLVVLARHRRHPWTVAMAIASASWYVIVAVRLTVADGSELAGRASTFVFVPAAYIAALAVAHLTGSVRSAGRRARPPPRCW